VTIFRPQLEVRLKTEISRVGFICQGNICRSPFSAAYLRQMKGMEKTAVWSAGLLAKDGTPADPLAIKTARLFGVSLEAHRAQRVRRELLMDSDVIFCFEAWHFLACRRICADAAGRIYLLAEIDRQSRNIPDPYGNAESTFVSCYKEIVRLSKRLCSLTVRRAC